MCCVRLSTINIYIETDFKKQSTIREERHMWKLLLPFKASFVFCLFLNDYI